MGAPVVVSEKIDVLARIFLERRPTKKEFEEFRFSLPAREDMFFTHRL